MSGARGSGQGVKNLLAMFENKDTPSPSKTPNREETRPKPLGRVSSSFIAVAKDGRFAGLQKIPPEGSASSVPSSPVVGTAPQLPELGTPRPENKPPLQAVAEVPVVAPEPVKPEVEKPAPKKLEEKVEASVKAKEEAKEDVQVEKKEEKKSEKPVEKPVEKARTPPPAKKVEPAKPATKEPSPKALATSAKEDKPKEEITASSQTKEVKKEEPKVTKHVVVQEPPKIIQPESEKKPVKAKATATVEKKEVKKEEKKEEAKKTETAKLRVPPNRLTPKLDTKASASDAPKSPRAPRSPLPKSGGKSPLPKSPAISPTKTTAPKLPTAAKAEPKKTEPRKTADSKKASLPPVKTAAAPRADPSKSVPTTPRRARPSAVNTAAKGPVKAEPKGATNPLSPRAREALKIERPSSVMSPPKPKSPTGVIPLSRPSIYAPTASWLAKHGPDPLVRSPTATGHREHRSMTPIGPPTRKSAETLKANRSPHRRPATAAAHRVTSPPAPATAANRRSVGAHLADAHGSFIDKLMRPTASAAAKQSDKKDVKTHNVRSRPTTSMNKTRSGSRGASGSRSSSRAGKKITENTDDVPPVPSLKEAVAKVKAEEKGLDSEKKVEGPPESAATTEEAPSVSGETEEGNAAEVQETAEGDKTPEQEHVEPTEGQKEGEILSDNEGAVEVAPAAVAV